MKFPKMVGIFGLLGVLAACQTTVQNNATNTVAGTVSVKSAVEARQSEFDGVHHAALENAEFYEAICNMTTESQIRAYYDARGFNMSSDGTGATAIAAINGDTFIGRMPSKAAAILRGCRGGHS